MRSEFLVLAVVLWYWDTARDRYLLPRVCASRTLTHSHAGLHHPSRGTRDPGPRVGRSGKGSPEPL